MPTSHLTYVARHVVGNQSTTTGVRSTLPAQARAGDLLIASIALRAALPSAAGTGFTEAVAPSGHNDTTMTGPPLGAYKIVDDRDVPGVTTYEWRAGTVNNSALALVVYRDSRGPITSVARIDPAAVTAAGSGTTISGGTITANSPSGAVFVVCGTNSGLNTEFTLYSSTMNERADVLEHHGNTQRMNAGIFDKLGTDVVAGSNAFETITQSRSETWGRGAFILAVTAINHFAYSGSKSYMVMG